MELVAISVTQIAEEVRFQPAFPKELLVGFLGVLARSKELLVELFIVKAGHWAAIQPQRACRNHEVGALE